MDIKSKFDKDLNHTTSHLLAAAVLKLFPNVKLGFGPATSEGFYYDFEFEAPLSDNDLVLIEKTMKKLANNGYKMIKVDPSEYSFDNQPYKQELFKEIQAKNQEATFYSLIDPNTKEHLFVDLCAGGHIESTAKIKHFKLLSLAGAYWRGDSNNIQLTRIYGTSWNNAEDLQEYLALVQDRKERDHRKIGKDLKLFTFSKLSGQGMPIWLENGMIIHNKIRNKILQLDRKYGFKEVLTPHFGEKELYERSGHWEHYRKDMFQPLDVDGELLVPRPMTCPHHIILYGLERKSYRDLPIRTSEQSRLYRYEKSGALTGLERVRSMDLTEGHIFARVDQIKSEFKHQYKLVTEALEFFGIQLDYISFSKRDVNDKEKYFDDDQMWNIAETALEEVLNELQIQYVVMEGEAAFYGPKIDFQIKTVLNHEITISTLQLDFLLPQKFNLSYINHNEEKQTPVIIHRGLIGTYERFISIILEQTKGNLPFWMAPNQIVVIPINNNKHHEHAKLINDKLFNLGFETKLDDREERINKKIREAQLSKTKFQIVIGDKEIEDNMITYREYGKEESSTISYDDFIKMIQKLNEY